MLTRVRACDATLELSRSRKHKHYIYYRPIRHQRPMRRPPSEEMNLTPLLENHPTHWYLSVCSFIPSEPSPFVLLLLPDYRLQIPREKGWETGCRRCLPNFKWKAESGKRSDLMHTHGIVDRALSVESCICLITNSYSSPSQSSSRLMTIVAFFRLRLAIPETPPGGGPVARTLE